MNKRQTNPHYNQILYELLLSEHETLLQMVWWVSLPMSIKLTDEEKKAKADHIERIENVKSLMNKYRPTYVESDDEL